MSGLSRPGDERAAMVSCYQNKKVSHVLSASPVSLPFHNQSRYQLRVSPVSPPPRPPFPFSPPPPHSHPRHPVHPPDHFSAQMEGKASMASGAVRCGARALTIIMFRVKVRFTETRGSGRPARSGAQRVSDLEAAAAAAAAPLPIGPRYTWTTPHGTRVHLLEDCAYLQRSKVTCSATGRRRRRACL